MTTGWLYCSALISDSFLFLNQKIINTLDSHRVILDDLKQPICLKEKMASQYVDLTKVSPIPDRFTKYVDDAVENE